MKSESFSSYRAALSGTGADIGGERDDEEPNPMTPTGEPSPGPQTHEEARQFHEGFLSGATAYAAAVGHSTLKRDNEKLREVFDAQGWRTIETFEKLKDDPDTEKSRRVYYQGIVYAVCNVLDRIIGGEIVCGTVASPTRQVQEAMLKIEQQCRDLARMKADQPHEKMPITLHADGTFERMDEPGESS